MELLDAVKGETVIRFNFINHNINPENIDVKLPTLLTFM
jgi:hypothetical protein